MIKNQMKIFFWHLKSCQFLFKDGTYAFPNGAKEAAEIFCYKTLETLERELGMSNLTENKINQAFKKAFDSANEKIKKLNIKSGIDKKLNYVEYDWFDTVGIAGFIYSGKVYYAYAGDCGMAIFDKNNKNKFQVKDAVKPAVDRFKKMHKNWKKLSSSERALIIHRDFRNSLNGKGYGSFSGEEGVKKYYNLGSKKLQDKDLLVFYSDGFFELLKNKSFVKLLREGDNQKTRSFVFEKAKENPDKFGTDRTFIASVFSKK